MSQEEQYHYRKSIRIFFVLYPRIFMHDARAKKKSKLVEKCKLTRQEYFANDTTLIASEYE